MNSNILSWAYNVLLVSSFLPWSALPFPSPLFHCWSVFHHLHVTCFPYPPLKWSVLLVSNLPAHSFLWYWPIAGTALSFFVQYKRKDISKLVFYLSFWIRSVVRNGGSKSWATKGADEHRRLSRRDYQFWAGTLNVKIFLLWTSNAWFCLVH